MQSISIVNIAMTNVSNKMGNNEHVTIVRFRQQKIYFQCHVLNPYPADQIFRLLCLPPNSTKVFFYTCIHTLPTVTKFYPTISSCTACQTYQKSRKIHNFFCHNFCRIFGLKLLNNSWNKPMTVTWLHLK